MVNTRQPMTEQERQLVAAQHAISLGNVALVRRNRMLAALHATGKYTQKALVELLNGAAVAAKDAPLSEAAVHKAIRRQQQTEAGER